MTSKPEDGRTSLVFEAPGDLSLGRVRIANSTGLLLDWTAASSNNRIMEISHLDAGFYVAEIAPVGVDPQSVIFEVYPGQANTVVIPDFAALTANGSAVSFLDVSDKSSASEAIRGLAKNLHVPSQNKQSLPSDQVTSPQLEVAMVRKETTGRNLSVGLSLEQEGSGGSWVVFPGTPTVEISGGALAVQVHAPERWDPAAGHRVRLAVAVQGVRVEGLLLPFFAGGTRVNVAPSPISATDVEVRVTPVDASRRALWRALDAGSSRDAQEVHDRVLKVQHGTAIGASETADPWSEVMAGLLWQRFPEVFGNMSAAWADRLATRFAWFADAHVLRARQALTKDDEAPDDATRADRVVSYLEAALDCGAPYFQLSNRFTGEIAETVVRHDILPASIIARARAVHERWLQNVPLQRGAGVSFSWLRRDRKSRLVEGAAVADRSPFGKLGPECRILFEGTVRAGHIGLRETEPTRRSKSYRLPDFSSPSDASSPSQIGTVVDCPALSREVTHLDDPNKGRFGRTPTRDGFELSAAFREDPTRSLIRISLTVRDVKRQLGRLGDFAWFCLHPTFDPMWIKTWLDEGRATLSVKARGGFTVGVWLPATQTELELDLSELDEAPEVIKRL